ncbi:MAG: hypothetical protein HUJ25_01560 [Crocinitomicaceae bacterium]|nr:hypothetical protein [Crocinitomicaceae bacterium]
MGYELNIERNKENLITASEWSDYLTNDPEFEAIEEFTAKSNDGLELSISTPNGGLWKKEVPFTFNEKWGQITVKNPDDSIIEKMIQISESLNAKVIGEEGEEYDRNYLSAKSEPKPKKKWWKF